MRLASRVIVGPAALAALLAACGEKEAEELKPSGAETLAPNSAQAAPEPPPETTGFASEVVAHFDHPWAIEFEPGTGRLFVTHRNGQISFLSPDRKIGQVTGTPSVDRGGQDGLGDLIFASDYAQSRRIYLSWVESDPPRKRGAVVGMARLQCSTRLDCALEGLQIIWRQSPTTSTFGHYSHRLLPSPDGEALYISSGERRQVERAQDNSSNLGTIVRLAAETGEPASGNPFAQGGPPADQIWSYGHRNVLGLAFDSNERLWAVEHGPIDGDELNLIKPGSNYGWPLVSNGHHSNGDAIPSPATRPDLAQAAISWTPVIAPSDMIIYNGKLFHGWQDNALISGLKSRALIRVNFTGESASEIARYPMPDRMRSLAQAPDGAIWIIEEGPMAQLLRLTPAQ